MRLMFVARGFIQYDQTVPLWVLTVTVKIPTSGLHWDHF